MNLHEFQRVAERSVDEHVRGMVNSEYRIFTDLVWDGTVPTITLGREPFVTDFRMTQYMIRNAHLTADLDP